MTRVDSIVGILRAYQFLIDTFIQLPLCRTALEHVVVVVVETLPVGTELIQTVFVQIGDPEVDIY
jgi:hypothetical protein